jgi:EAL domain-containing protein (putative c-di-GMP-specific phosphodiesterase class I)/PleD family two-component response regulator
MMKKDIWAATAEVDLDDAEAMQSRSPLLDAKVMMVDDEPLMTDLIQAHLEDGGYTNFVVCNEPRRALDLLKREKPGLLLLDLMMPGISGFEILEAVRADRELRYTPVIVLTAATNAESKLQALQLGVTEFLAKPVDASELVLRVRNTLAFQVYHERLINFDHATGLPNETMFETNLGELMELQAQQGPKGGMLALFSITVPECRQLRESVDRRTADKLAAILARRLERLVASELASAKLMDSGDRRQRVGRLGEQHFCVLIDGLRDVEAVEDTAKAILATLSEPVRLGSHELATVPWLGIAIAPDDGQNAATLRQSADLAATHGRQQGKSQITFASPELNTKSYERLMLAAQLRGAAQRGELRLHYQPKVDIATNRIIGVEALARWQHPDHGLMAPDRFIALAEETGIMVGLGQWVIERACRDIGGWMQAGLGELTVAVNVSKLQLTTGSLGQLVRKAMFDNGVPARQLMIELTESMLMDNVQQCVALMHELKALGVTLSIDDFGTGYSSLSYLKRFPVDELKIDRSFVSDLPGSPTDVALVRTVIELGHSLGMKVTAEGVETDEQLACLKRFGCDAFQGFLFSRPLTLEQCIELLAASPHKTARRVTA